MIPSTILAVGMTVAAQTSPAVKLQEPAPAAAIAEPRSAHQAVHDGNRQLIAGQPSAALEAYKHAEQLVPDAREIAFVEGLAHFDLEDYEAARGAFHRVGAFGDDALSDDALYSLGACDHAEALQNIEENPQLALSQFESAIQRYQDLLARRPDHKYARGAIYKAASMWRELKRQLEQQQQEQQNGDKEGDDKNEQQQQEQSQDQKDQQEKEQDKQSQQSEKEQSEQQEKQQQASQQQEEQDQQQQQAKAEKQEQVSREQAQRKLREIMQAIRDRKKQRRRQVRKVPVTPVDKDW